MTTTSDLRRSLPLKALILLCAGLALGAACKKEEKSKNPEKGLQHRGGIPIIPRGTVKTAAPKGEKYFLEIHANVTLSQALSFYRRQLTRDRWEGVVTVKLKDQTYGLQAKRGLFRLTGRIRKIPKGPVEILFEREVVKEETAPRPGVPKDLEVLEQKIKWSQRVFAAGSNRVEIRGKSRLKLGDLANALRRGAQAKGWSIDDSGNKADGSRLLQGVKAKRKLTYRLDAMPRGTLIRLALGAAEFAGDARGAEPMRAPIKQADAGVKKDPSAGLIPLPAEFHPWKTTKPIMGRKLNAILTFSIDRKCNSEQQLAQSIEKTLRRRGFARLQGSPLGGGGAPNQVSLTLVKRKKMIVIVVRKDDELCVVDLTIPQPQK